MKNEKKEKMKNEKKEKMKNEKKQVATNSKENKRNVNTIKEIRRKKLILCKTRT